MGDHIHMCISIPPKYAVSKVVGYIKGKSAIMIARKLGGKTRNFKGKSFGSEVILCQLLGWMSTLFERISELRMKEISVLIRWICRFSDSNLAPFRG